MSGPGAYVLLFFVGLLAGTINVVAAGGSFITLPLLIFLGLPASVANGTNRIAILVQNVGAVWSFDRHGVMQWRWVRRAALPALAGGALGTWAAIRIGDASFQRILAGLMIVFVAVILLDPLRRRLPRIATDAGAPPLSGAAFPFVFFGVGAYGGFVQAGVGFVILSIAMLAGLDLVRGNALKVLVVLAFTPLALTLFALAGKVDWGLGIALACGNLLGGLVGAHLTVLKGHGWVKRIVLAMVVVFALKLWLAP